MTRSRILLTLVSVLSLSLLVPVGAQAVPPKSPLPGPAQTLRCPGISIDAGGPVVLKGRVVPAGADVKVTYQVRWDGTAWRDKATIRPTARGSYRFAVQVPRSAPLGRTYEWRVVATSGRTVVATSQVRSSLVREDLPGTAAPRGRSSGE